METQSHQTLGATLWEDLRLSVPFRIYTAMSDPTPLEVRWADPQSLFDRSNDWNRLTRGVPTRSTHWIEPWWQMQKTVSAGDASVKPAVAACYRGDRLVGVMPLYCDAAVNEHPSGTLRAMGDGNACTDYVSVLCEPDDIESVPTAIAKFLIEQSAVDGGWSMLDLDGVAEDDEAVNRLLETLRDRGASTHGVSRMSSWQRPKSESWDAHLRCHGKTQRRRMRRMTEKFDTVEGASRVLASDVDTTIALVDDLIRLHQARWTSAGELGTYHDPAFREFIHAVAQNFLATGRLHLVAMRLHEQTIAVELNIVGEDRVLYQYSAGYDVDHADLEPGRILHVDSMRQMYEGLVDECDFMRGDESYKQRYGTASRRIFRHRVFAPSWLPQIRYQAFRAGFELKQLIRRSTKKELLVTRQ